MNYKQKIIFNNKHHISSAFYHLVRVTPSIRGDYAVVDKDQLSAIKKQLIIWERDLYLAIQNDSE